MIELTLLFGAMLFGNFLRRTIRPLRNSLIPSSVIAGFLLLAVNGVYKKLAGVSMFSNITLETMTYHCLGLGFVALALKSSQRNRERKARVDVFNTGVTVVSTYLLQALVGLSITLGLSYVLSSWASAGLLLPMGYGQGPGQAYNWGNVYESATAYPAFTNGASFGLTVAAMGFVSASVGGVIYLSFLKAKNRLKGPVANAQEIEDLSAEMITQKGEIPISESLDKFTVQFGLVFLTYMVGYLIMHFSSLGLDRLGGFFSGTVKPLVWGFNFLIGTLCALLFKFLLRWWKQAGFLKRAYTNDFMLSRVAGVMFDVMVTASIAAIDLSAFKEPSFVLPLVLVCVLGAVATYAYINHVAKRTFPDYADESFLMLYGMLTGTASTGVILLREIDPLFQTPAANNLIYQQLWAIVFGFPMLLLLGVSPQSTGWTWFTLGCLVILFVVMNLILFRKRIFGKNKQA